MRLAVYPVLTLALLLAACDQQKTAEPAATTQEPLATTEEPYSPPSDYPMTTYTPPTRTTPPARPATQEPTYVDDSPSAGTADSSGEVLEPRTRSAPAAGRTYVVKKGDTLAGISKRFYGKESRWRSIYNANRNRIKDPNKLQIGTKLTIP
jgi:nucleoid-associated protein YgaU